MRTPDNHALAMSMARLASGVVHATGQQATAQQRHQLLLVGRVHEREWTERVGLARGDIFHQADAAQRRVAQSVRPGANSRHVVNARRLWGARGEQMLTLRTSGLRAHLRVAGTQAVDALIAGDDPLTRLTLLQGLLQQLGADHPARSGLQDSIDRLQAAEGDAIQALENAASAFIGAPEDEAAGSASVHGTPTTGRTAASDATPAPDADELAALRRSYAALVGPRQRRQDRPLGALQLAQSLLREVGEDGFERALVRLARGATQDLQSARPSRAAVQVRVAMADATAFTTVRSLLTQVHRCERALQGQIPAMPLRDGPAAAEVLRLADQAISDVQAWAAALAGVEHAPVLMDTPPALRELRRFVAQLPAVLWGGAADAGRLKVQLSLDQHAEHLSAEAGPSAGDRANALDRLDPRLAGPLSAALTPSLAGTSVGASVGTVNRP